MTHEQVEAKIDGLLEHYPVLGRAMVADLMLAGASLMMPDLTTDIADKELWIYKLGQQQGEVLRGLREIAGAQKIPAGSASGKFKRTRRAAR